MSSSSRDPSVKEAVGGFAFIGLVLFGLIFLFMWGCPTYSVWKKGKDGEALLREAESSRQIAVEESKAKKESAVLLAQAEVERAKGVAEANKIIGEGLKGHNEYLAYLWIMSLEHTSSGDGTVVYVPTESNLPILEAGRFGKMPPKLVPEKE